METGVIIKSTTFHVNPYWVVKCDNPNLENTKNGELELDPLTQPSEFTEFMGRFYPTPLLDRKVKFEVLEIPKGSKRFYAVFDPKRYL